MNIQDAIKSGKPFKRKEWSNGAWYTVENGLRYLTEDVLADDWEIQDRAITITESQFNEAWGKFVEFRMNQTQRIGEKLISSSSDVTNDIRDRIKKELGF